MSEPNYAKVLNPQMEKTKLSNLTKSDLTRLINYLEQEVHTRDVVINALKTEHTKQILYQAKYGRFGPGDPFNALQRDSAHVVQDNFDQAQVKSLFDNQLQQLENLIETQRHAQTKMKEQKQLSDERYRKVCCELEEERHKHAQDTAQGDDVTVALEKEREKLKQDLLYEKNQNRKLEKDLRKLQTQLDEQIKLAAKHKQVALDLIKERRKMVGKMAEAERHNDTIAKLLYKEQQDRMQTEKSKLLQLEAKMEKQLMDFDIEREQLKAKIRKEEAKVKELVTQLTDIKETVVAMQCESLGEKVISTSKEKMPPTAGPELVIGVKENAWYPSASVVMTQRQSPVNPVVSVISSPPAVRNSSPVSALSSSLANPVTSILSCSSDSESSPGQPSMPSTSFTTPSISSTLANTVPSPQVIKSNNLQTVPVVTSTVNPSAGNPAGSLIPSSAQRKSLSEPVRNGQLSHAVSQPLSSTNTSVVSSTSPSQVNATAQVKVDSSTGGRTKLISDLNKLLSTEKTPSSKEKASNSTEKAASSAAVSLVKNSPTSAGRGSSSPRSSYHLVGVTKTLHVDTKQSSLDASGSGNPLISPAKSVPVGPGQQKSSGSSNVPPHLGMVVPSPTGIVAQHLAVSVSAAAHSVAQANISPHSGAARNVPPHLGSVQSLHEAKSTNVAIWRNSSPAQTHTNSQSVNFETSEQISSSSSLEEKKYVRRQKPSPPVRNASLSNSKQGGLVHELNSTMIIGGSAGNNKPP